MRLVPALVGVAATAVVAAATVTAGGAGATTLPEPAATNTSGCVATAPLPARLSVGRSGHVRIASTLTGNAACGQWEDDGAEAILVAGDGRRVAQLQWPHAFGQVAFHDVWASDVRPGRYTIERGTVHLYTSSYSPLTTQWVPTSTDVRYAGRFAAVHAATTGRGLTITATAERFRRDDLFHGFGHVRVTLQRRTGSSGSSGSSWTSAASATANGKGVVRFAVRPGTYRLSFAATPTVWGATSHAIGARSVINSR